jgi:hypothetical protein
MCDCKGIQQVSDPQLKSQVDEPEDEMALLKKYESELAEELKEIRSRIKEAKNK